MASDHDDDDRVAAMLSRLPREVEPPAHLAARTAAALRHAGLLPPRRRWWRGVAAAVIAAAFVSGAFVSGWMLGGRVPADPVPTSRYLLLLYPGDRPAAGEGPGLVDEYRQWARSVRAGGRYVTGERLDNRPGVGLGDVEPGGVDALQGYFVIEADTDEEVLAMAKGHPHLRHGGRIVIRRILPT